MRSTSSSVEADVNVNVITPEDVLESLMNDGTIDAIRLKIISQLKANEELKNNTISMVEQSKVLNTPGAEKQTKRELFDALRQELETPALERASKAVWELILDNDGLGKEINQTVHNVFCRLSGLEPPPSPTHHHQHQLKQIDLSHKTKDKDTDHSHSPPSKKRTFNDTSPQIEPHPPSLPLDSVADSRKAGDQCRNNMEEDDEPWRCKRTDGKQWRCKDDRAPNQKFCERHMYKGKKPRKQMENSNQGTSSSNNMVDSAPPNITTSTPSQLVAAGNTSLSPGSSSKTDTQ